MADSRLQSAGKAATTRPKMAVNSNCLPCARCADAWNGVMAETSSVIKASSPEERNKKISAAYAEMNLRRPDLQWIGLAAIVSRQAG